MATDRKQKTKSGFTLIEILTVLVLMGILAAFSTKVASNKAAAAMAVMKSDVRNIATAQEAYFADHGVYAASAADLNFQASDQITLSIRGNPTGWAAQTQHELRSNYRCALFTGSVTPFAPATEEGVLACEPKATGGGCFGG